MKKTRVFRVLGKRSLAKRPPGHNGNKDTLSITQPRKRDNKGL